MDETKGEESPAGETANNEANLTGAAKPKTSSFPPPPAPATVEDDSDPDFDDLDDVLDQFSLAAALKHQPPQPHTPTISGPGRPHDAAGPPTPSAPPPSAAAAAAASTTDETEEEFMERLATEMSSVLQGMNMDAAESDTTAAQMATMSKEVSDFTEAMEKGGVKPEDLLKAVLGDATGTQVADVAHAERDKRDAAQPTVAAAGAATTSGGSSGSKSTSFEDTIRKTMERIENSGTSATNAAAAAQTGGDGNEEEDMLAELLRALESEGGTGTGSDGDVDGMSKMFMGMMEQLTHKDMLYEPMKELDERYPSWLQQNQPPKLQPEDWKRFNAQSHIVSEIVAKFEEPAYRDEDSQCREFIWDKMQKMQAEGSPPEDLVANPLPGIAGGLPGLGGGGGEGGGSQDAGAGGDQDVGCPTQ